MPRELDNADEGWASVQEKIGEVLAPFAEFFGARQCAHGDWAECETEGEGCRFTDTQPKPGSQPVIQNWVLTITTVDLSAPTTQRSDQVLIDAPNQPGFVTRGLLWDGLNG